MINEIKEGFGIEVRGVIKDIQPVRELWKCFKCNSQGMWRKAEEFKEVCPNCQASQSDIPKQGLWIQKVTSAILEDETGTCYLDLWKEDIDKFKVGDKIHLINGFAKRSGTGNINLGKGKFGSIRLLQ